MNGNKITRGVLMGMGLLAGCGEASEGGEGNSFRLNGATANWNAEGPFLADQGQVENVSPDNLVIGAIHTVVAHPTNPDILYVGSVNGGLWRTDDATDVSPEWTALTDFESSLSIGALAMDPADPNTLVAGLGRYSSFGRIGGPLDGLLLTQDGGGSWTAIDDPLLLGQNVSGVHVEGQRILASSSSSSGGVFRSTDGGSTWARVLSVPFAQVFDMVVDPSDSNRVYVTVGGTGLFFSSDGGQTFVDVAPNDPNLQAALQDFRTNNAEMAMGSDGRLYVVVMLSGQTGYIAHTSDQGATWTAMDLPRVPVTGLLPVVDASNTTPIVITTAAPHGFPPNSGNVRVRVTGVTGNTAANGDWTVAPIPPGAPNNQFTLVGSAGNGAFGGAGSWQRFAQLNPREKPGGQGGIHLSVLVDPNDSDTVYIGGDRQEGAFPNFIGAINFSGNLVRGDAAVGATGAIPSPQWEHLTHSNAVAAIPGGGTASSSSPHADSREMTFDANGDIIEVDDGGIYRRTSPTDNTGDWFSLNGDLSVTEFHDIAYDPVSGVIIGGAQDNGNPQQDSPGSDSWTLFTQADGGDVQVDAVSVAGQSIRYTSTQELGNFTRTTFDNNNVELNRATVTAIPPAGTTLTAQFVTPFELNTVNPQRMVIGYVEGVFESMDQGDNIVPVAGGGANARGMAYGHPDNEELLWVAAGDVLVRTTAGGALASTGFPGGALDVVSHPDDAATAYAMTNDQVFVTTDTGGTWTDVTGDLVQLDTGTLRQIAYIPGTVDRVTVACDAGVFVMGENVQGFWNELGPQSLPNALVLDLDYEPANDFLVVSTMGRGAWSLDVASTIDLPPAAICQDVTVEADAVCEGFADAEAFDGGTIDPEGQPLSFSVSPTDPYPLGTTPVTLEITDVEGAREQCDATVTVIDVTPPEIAPLDPLALTRCNAEAEAIEIPVPEATDNCDPDPMVTGRVVASTNPNLPLPIDLVDGVAVVGAGVHTIEWTATDFSGNVSAVVQQTVSVSPALYVARDFDLRDRGRLTTPAGAGATLGNVGAPGNGRTAVGVEAFMGEIFSGPFVDVRDRASLDGGILSRSFVTLGNNVSVDGAVIQGAASLPIPGAPSLPTDPLPVGPNTDLNVEPDRSASLAPGAYGNVRIASRSVLDLSTGVYSFDRLQLEPQATLRLDMSAGPILLVVEDFLQPRAVQVLGGDPLDLTLVYLGSNDVVFEFPWDARFFAPDARLVFGANGALTFRGQFSVRNIELRPDTTFVCQFE